MKNTVHPSQDSITNPLDNVNLADLTPLIHPEKASIIEHINEDHAEELQNFLRVFKQIPEKDLRHLNIRLKDIFVEGFIIQSVTKQQHNTGSTSEQLQNTEIIAGGVTNAVTETIEDTNNNPNNALAKDYYIRFKSPIDNIQQIQMQYILLKQQVDKKIGKKTIKLTPQQFKLKNSYRVSKNMQRLVLVAIEPATDTAAKDENYCNLLDHAAGYAYLFDLNTARQTKKPEREHCYYTLRKAIVSNDGKDRLQNKSSQDKPMDNKLSANTLNDNSSIEAWVDVYIHGDTSGGNWANNLQAADIVTSTREFPEKIEHLHKGQALLIADETSIPTVSRLIETWQNPIPPLVLYITHDEADQAYLDAVEFSANLTDSITVIPLVIGHSYRGQALADLIDHHVGDYLTYNPLQIDTIWGALESSTIKALKPLFKQRFDLPRSQMVLKVYWRHH